MTSAACTLLNACLSFGVYVNGLELLRMKKSIFAREALWTVKNKWFRIYTFAITFKPNSSSRENLLTRLVIYLSVDGWNF